jgi:adenine-specific DNA-methyltransferase
MIRLAQASRLILTGNTLMYKRYFDDFPVTEIANHWSDVRPSFQDRLYAVQTAERVVERCILMTTDPGDLVFDPTCGSGTTAWCAEKWGRRWITCDTSRVALAIARQRLMTAKFDYYEPREPERGPAGGFIYETVPHITLESIAKNTEIDAIAARYQPQIDQALADLNRALGREWKEWEVPREVPHPVWPRGGKSTPTRDSHAEKQSASGRSGRSRAFAGTGLSAHRSPLGAERNPRPMPPEDWPDAAKGSSAPLLGTQARKR